MRSASGIFVAVTLVVGGAAACGGERVETGPTTTQAVDRTSAPGNEVDPPPADLFAIDDPDVAAGPPDPLLVPPEDLSDGAVVTGLTLPEGQPPTDPPRPDRGAQTLYADPDDPARSLVVGRTESSDTGGGFPNDGEPLDLDGVEATVADRGEIVVVTFPMEVDDDCDCDQTAVVAGRGLDRSEVVAAARAAQPDAARPEVDPSALPDGMTSLGTAPVVDPFEDTRNRAEVFVVTQPEVDPEAEILLIALRGDPRLVHHLAFWVADGRHEGALLGADASLFSVEGTDVLAVGAGIDPDVAETVAAQFVPGTQEEAEAAVEAAEDAERGRPASPADSCLGDEVDPDTSAVIVGNEADLRWTVGAAIGVDGEVETCLRAEYDSGSSSSSFAGYEPASDAATVALGAGAAGYANGPKWTIVVGDVTAAATSVAITIEGSEAVAVTPEATGPTGDRRWFAVAVRLPGDDGRDATITAVATDDAGTQVAEGVLVP